MLWFRTKNEHGYKQNLASPAEIDKAFEEQSGYLKWLAEVITGDRALAEQCVADARRAAMETSGVFSDWSVPWARAATIERAVEYVGHEIGSSSHRYAQVRCLHGGHAPLTLVDIDSLREICPQEIVAELDPFARAVLLLRSVQRCTVQDCALRLGSVRSAVAGACCALEQWLHLRAARFSGALEGAPALAVQDIAESCMKVSAWS